MQDIFVIGGGINGCGIARDAAGRGLSVTLAEKGDLAQATSSASTKLFHGGLRYLEYFEIRLVREALQERETLLRAMPHISWPMRFVLPLSSDMRFDTETPAARLLNTFMPWMKGKRPSWMIRAGLMLYDTLGGRQILPGTKRLDLTRDAAGQPLQDRFATAFEYSDCWVQDARLVVLNARDAEARGARIMTRTEVVSTVREADHWRVTCRDSAGTETEHRARLLVNAAGPWAADVLGRVAHVNSREKVRLVRGSHVVTKRLFDHDRAYFFQGSDGRIIFAIPYEQDFTLIGTTDQDHGDADTPPECTDAEADYLLAFASGYFRRPLTRADIVWRYSGVRPLYDDGASSATAATRDYVLTLDRTGAPLLSVFGGKITTYRRLAESALEKIGGVIDVARGPWTAGVALPGGDIEVAGVDPAVAALQERYPFLAPGEALRLFRTYGTETAEVLGAATDRAGLGRDFGGGLSEAEVRWLMTREYARTAADVLWRRTKLGLRLSEDEARALEVFMAGAVPGVGRDEEETAQ
ncbi:glycerol-3-phosphate dehydrogenase [Marinibacterium sp. SX1]|uniref:glycerol-3-phosphate dehydrogenase n=1 Tax=Marinibacterium sp. SX1 TaxID=3388424 RepID=UPI003D184CCF